MSNEQAPIAQPQRLPPHERSMWGPLQPFGEALRFLTALPVPGLPPMSETGIVRSMAAFPLAGLVIGAGGAGV